MGEETIQKESLKYVITICKVSENRAVIDLKEGCLTQQVTYELRLKKEQPA